MDRQLPDIELHDLLHKLAEARKVIDDIYTKIYEHIELKDIHERTVRKMIEER